VELVPLTELSLLSSARLPQTLLGVCELSGAGQPSITRGVENCDPAVLMRRDKARLLTVNALKCDTSVNGWLVMLWSRLHGLLFSDRQEREDNRPVSSSAIPNGGALSKDGSASQQGLKTT